MSTELSIIVYSCWKNRDMWAVFSALFHKYWENCDYKVILVTDEYHDEGKCYVFDDVVVCDDIWAKMIKAAIKRADTKYVMLFMDDYLLCDYVSNQDIQKQIGRARKYNAANMRLVESPICKGKYKGNIGYYKCGEAYSVSTQIGIWDTDYLNKKICDKWSAWDFERIGSLEKKHNAQPLLAALDYTFPYVEGVRKGKWMIEGEKLCRRNGIKLDPSIRPVMTNYDMAKVYLKGAILDWNPTLILKLQNLLQNIKIRMPVKRRR